MKNNQLRLHIHSDCSFFAGCEMMIANIVNDEIVRHDFIISYSYRHSSAYYNGIVKFLKNNSIIYFPLWFVGRSIYTVGSDNIFLNRMLKAIFLPLELALFVYEYFVLLVILMLRTPDILHVNNGGYPGARSSRAAILAGKTLNVKKIILVINNEPQDYTYVIRKLDLPLDFLIFKSITYLITASEFSRRKSAQLYQVPIEKTKCIPNCIGRSLISSFHTKSNHIRIGVVALLIKRKGHSVLLEAIKLLVKSAINSPNKFVLYIEGDGPELPRLRSFVVENKLDDYVEFIGISNNVIDFIASNDLMILPSISNEDFPNVNLESMALGKPIISTKVAGIPEQIIPGVTGFIVDPGDVAALSAAIQYFLDCPYLLAKMGEAAKSKFQEEYRCEIIVKKYIEIYKGI